MPVEIHELIIRAVVASGSDREDSRRGISDADRDALIQACVDETLRILRRERER